jgi:hypothetical protein
MFHNSTLYLKTIKVEMSGWHSHVFWKIWQYLSSVYCHTFPTWTLKDGLNCYSVVFQHKKQQWLNNAKFDIEKHFLAVFVILIVKARSQFYALNVEVGTQYMYWAKLNTRATWSLVCPWFEILLSALLLQWRPVWFSAFFIKVNHFYFGNMIAFILTTSWKLSEFLVRKNGYGV